MSEVERWEDVVQKERRVVGFTSNKATVKIYPDDTHSIKLLCDDSSVCYRKERIPDIIAVLEAAQRELDGADKLEKMATDLFNKIESDWEDKPVPTETNRLPIVMRRDGKEYPCEVWLKKFSNEIYFRIKTPYNYNCWDIIELSDSGDIRMWDCINDSALNTNSEGQVVITNYKPGKSEESAPEPKVDDTETNKIKFEHSCVNGVKIAESNNFYSERGLGEIYFRKYFKNINDDIRFDIKLLPEFAEFVQVVADENKLPSAMKPLITAADWREYFTNEADMMNYNVERAKAEYENLIANGWGKAEAANYISMKKWIAKANGNTEYLLGQDCGYCFAWERTKRSDEFPKCSEKCLYGKLYPSQERNVLCDTTNPAEMIERFQNPELLAAIKE